MDYSKNERVSVEDIICSDIEQPHDKKEVMDWINLNCSKCYLIADGLDQSPYKLENPVDYETPNLTKKLLPSIILPKILSGDLLFNGANVFILSRPDGVINLPPACRPKSAIRLVGFSPDNVEKLLAHYFEDREKAVELLQDLKMTNKSIWQLLRTPVFLQLFVLLPEERRRSFKNSTELYQYLFHRLSRSQHMSDINFEEDTMKKLRKLSFEKSLEGKVLMSGADFERHQININKIKKICIVAINPEVENTYLLLQGEINYFLVHQTVQVISFN